ncbi:hypothetical protein K2173_005317 [Erythroxylum novogranatense]|uniref:Uncharacterized protein n=1 Tax=Erythroxylum novogranatense TaxID=1862640 RepID=A0AAV8TIH8_9ROSI|nr:hypothetical protein K2173_005317 [Erythroxylum novogranatense]
MASTTTTTIANEPEQQSKEREEEENDLTVDDEDTGKERCIGNMNMLKHKKSRKVQLLMGQSKTQELRSPSRYVFLPSINVQEHHMIQGVAEDQEKNEEGKYATNVIGQTWLPSSIQKKNQ